MKKPIRIEISNRIEWRNERGELHREDGPAVEWKDGAKEWYINGMTFKNKEDWFKALTKEERLAYLFNMEL